MYNVEIWLYTYMHIKEWLKDPFSAFSSTQYTLLTIATVLCIRSSEHSYN